MARPRSDIRPRVVDAARVRFLADGVDGASLRGIAKDAGTSVGMVHYYFPSKDELFFAVVEDVYGGLLEELQTLLTGDGGFEERLEEVAVHLGHMSETELDVVRIIIREALVSTERRDRLLMRFSKGHLALLYATLERAAAEGELDASLPLPALVPMIFGTTVLPQLLRRIVGADAPGFLAHLPEPKQLANLGTHVLMHGIGKPETGEE